MTTASKRTGVATTVTPVLLGAAAVSILVGASLGVVGGLTDGRSAAWSAVVGTVVVVGLFGLGSAAVDVVASVMPAASLVFALLTYLLQLAVLLLVLAAVERSGALGDTLDRTWLAAAVVGGALAWTLGQVVLTTRRRIPVYDLPEPLLGVTTASES